MRYSEGEWVNAGQSSIAYAGIQIERKTDRVLEKSIAIVYPCPIDETTKCGKDQDEAASGNARLMVKAPRMYEALREITQGKGAYSQDRLTHAENCIKDMRELAESILAEVEGREPCLII